VDEAARMCMKVTLIIAVERYGRIPDRTLIRTLRIVYPKITGLPSPKSETLWKLIRREKNSDNGVIGGAKGNPGEITIIRKNNVSQSMILMKKELGPIIEDYLDDCKTDPVLQLLGFE
jgi:hypothetical protein